MSEERLICLAQQGDRDALGEIIELYQSKILNFCYRVTGNREDSRDLAQDTFLRVASSIRSFRNDAPFSAWLYRIANNVCVDYIRKKARSRMFSLDAPHQTEDGDIYAQVSDCSPTPCDEVLYEELKKAVVRAILDLSYDHRSVVIMHDVQHMTYQHISDTLGCPIGTVKSRLARARAQLRQQLYEEGLVGEAQMRRETFRVALASIG